jgi:GNAT superfamily N-acetyltransferase
MDHHAAIDPHYARTPDAHERFAEHLRQVMGEDAHAVFVAVDPELRAGPDVASPGTIVGYAKASLAEYPPIVSERKYGSVTDMAVASTHRRRGAGRLLLQACEDWLRSKGVRRVEVRVLKGNPDGEAFWSGQGYSDFLLVKWKRI